MHEKIFAIHYNFFLLQRRIQHISEFHPLKSIRNSFNHIQCQLLKRLLQYRISHRGVSFFFLYVYIVRFSFKRQSFFIYHLLYYYSRFDIPNTSLSCTFVLQITSHCPFFIFQVYTIFHYKNDMTNIPPFILHEIAYYKNKNQILQNLTTHFRRSFISVFKKLI